MISHTFHNGGAGAKAYSDDGVHWTWASQVQIITGLKMVPTITI